MIEKLVRGQMAGVAGSFIMLLAMGLLRLLSIDQQFLPLAVMTTVFDIHGSAVVLLALLCHFVYGVAWGVVFVSWLPRGKAAAGTVFSILPWLGLMLFLLPLMKTNFHYSLEKPWIAFSTLLMHLCYGAALGWTNHFMGQRWKIECYTRTLQASSRDSSGNPAQRRSWQID